VVSSQGWFLPTTEYNEAWKDEARQAELPAKLARELTDQSGTRKSLVIHQVPGCCDEGCSSLSLSVSSAKKHATYQEDFSVPVVPPKRLHKQNFTQQTCWQITPSRGSPANASGVIRSGGS